MRKPDLSGSSMSLSLEYVNKVLGVTLEAEQAAGLLERMRYAVDVEGDTLSVKVPAYRTDVLHPIDLAEDVAIAYGYMNFKAEIPKAHAVGALDSEEVFWDGVSELMVGLGFREVMSLVLTSRRELFEKMEKGEEPVVEAVKAVSSEQSVARSWLLPSLLGVLEKNRNREYPQRIYEVGDVLDADGTRQKKVAAAIAHAKTNYSEIRSVVGGLLSCLDLETPQESFAHPSFIEGRCCAADVGFYGELSPKVLSNFGLEVPVTAFELSLR